MRLKSVQTTADARPAILYVDDEVQSLKYFTRAFGEDFAILTAASAAEAEALLESKGERIGALITDQRMPAQSGVQLLERMKVRYPQIVRLLTTAYADLDDAIAAVNRGEIHRYILKPWDIDALRAELRGAMGLYQRKRHEQELLKARRRTMMSLASHIAHELGTPLSTIRAAVGTMNEHLPDLLRVYRPDTDGGLRPPIPDTVMELLETTPGMMLSLVDRTNMLIRLLLMNAAEDAEDRSDYSLFSVDQCIREALRTYPFSEGERRQVRLEGANFEVRGSEVLLQYVLYNLLKNSLDAIGAARKGEILIRSEPGVPNRVLFRDTGTGIPPHVLPHVFDEFFSGKGAGRGTGMGLAFCRRVLKALGGNIVCRSRLGEFTEMELRFPRVEEAAPQGGVGAPAVGMG